MLRVRDVSKRFGTVQALHRVDLDVTAGEVVALIGENGAGKSTLLSCVAGFVVPDGGRIEIEGTTLATGDPAAALGAGVGAAFQHFALVPTFTVAESFALAGIPRAAWRPLVGDLPGSARIETLGMAERVRVELVRARLTGTRVLLLDEPTSPVGAYDAESVLAGIGEAAASGRAVVLVTHRLREALRVADRIAVMRHGFMVGVWAREEEGWPEAIERDLIAAMFGTGDDTDRVTIDRSNVGVNAEDGPSISVADRGSGLEITAWPGRVLAVVGIAGNGERELAALLAGDRDADVQTRGGAVDARWLRRHAVLIPADRMAEGGAADMALGDTLVLRDLTEGRGQRGGVVSTRWLRRRAQNRIERWGITPSDPSARYGDLSGGNMQRVALARALDPAPALLVAVNPVQGLDLATSITVRGRLRDVANAGAAVVTIEGDLDDAIGHADDIAVLFRCRVSVATPAPTVGRQRLQLMMVAGW